jgi:Transposase DDE domain group 1
VGETQDWPFQLSFNSSLKVDFQGSRVTSDGGLVLVRELDERLGLSELMERHLSDSRRARISNCLWRTCCGSRSIAAWPGMRMSMTVLRKIIRMAANELAW